MNGMTNPSTSARELWSESGKRTNGILDRNLNAFDLRSRESVDAEPGLTSRDQISSVLFALKSKTVKFDLSSGRRGNDHCR